MRDILSYMMQAVFLVVIVGKHVKTIIQVSNMYHGCHFLK
jgi:hypothetical protein